MLTDHDKERIKDEEEYKEKLKKDKHKPLKFWEKAENIGKVAQTLAVVLGIIGVIVQYATNSSAERREAARDYQKSFYQSQMAVYAEAVNETSILSTTRDTASVEFKDSYKRFLRLFWGRVSMFEDKCVEARMAEFRTLLLKYRNRDSSVITITDSCDNSTCNYSKVSREMLEIASLRLAHTCRVYTIKTWLEPTEQESYHMDVLRCIPDSL